MLHGSTFPNQFGKNPSPISWTGAEFEQWLSSPVSIADKDQRPAWSPTVYQEGTKRANANVQAVTAVVLDYDDGTAWDDATGPWRQWAGAAHTSYRHLPGPPAGYHPDLDPEAFGPPKAQRYRVILPLFDHCPAEMWPRLWMWARDVSGQHIDKTCKNSSRIYFSPCHKPGRGIQYRYDMWGGPILNWKGLDLPELPKPKPKARRATPVDGLAPWQVAALEAKRIDTDPDARVAWVESMGGRVDGTGSGRMGRGMTCPGCQQDTMCLIIDYTEKRSAWCNHANTCNYYGFPWSDKA